MLFGYGCKPYIPVDTAEEKGTILIRGEIKNDAEQKASLELEHIIYNPDGSIVPFSSDTCGVLINIPSEP